VKWGEEVEQTLGLGGNLDELENGRDESELSQRLGMFVLVNDSVCLKRIHFKTIEGLEGICRKMSGVW
jgi:hypothetical protein